MTGDSKLDFSPHVCPFLLLGPEDQIFALNEFTASSDFSTVSPRIAKVNFRPLMPLISGVKPSHMVLVLHPGERAQGYFLVDVGAGANRRNMRVFQKPSEIAESALEQNLLPCIVLRELQQATVLSRKNQAPLSVRVRYLELRSKLPENWLQRVRDITLVNMTVCQDKSEVLNDRLRSLENEIRYTMVSKFLDKCVWLDTRSGLLGRLSPSKADEIQSRFGFAPFLGADANLQTFIKSLAKDRDGRYETRTGFANVLPHLIKEVPWASPTVHVFDDEFRDKFGLETFTSLYRGLDEISSIGVPVLGHEPGGIGEAIPVYLLRPIISGSGLMQASIRSYATAGLVWSH